MQVTILRTFILFGILVMLAAGCLGPVQTPPAETPDQGQEPSVTCTTVTDSIPYTDEECSDVTVSEPVCQRRELNYSTTQLAPVHLCSSDGACTGKPLNECFSCTKAMSRCRLVLTNLDADKPGTWKAGANFSIGSASFIKEIQTAVIKPGENHTFDFYQIYTPEQFRRPASCAVFVLEVPEIDDCRDVIRTAQECKNVTKFQLVDRQVCQ